jgi:hypothetical protein
MLAEDERADPQAVNNSRTSAEGVVVQNPATRGWRESRRPYKFTAPRQQGPKFNPLRPGKASVSDGSACAVLNGK